MFKPDRKPAFPTDIDLATVRGTLRYIEDDMRRVPALEQAAAAIEAAIREIDKAQAKSPPEIAEGVVTHARFVPFRRTRAD